MVERRQPKPTVDFIDEYCQYYRNLFSDVRDLQVINCPTVSQNFRAKPRRVVVSLDRATPTVGQFIFWIFLRGFEAFKYLHMGMISEIKRKTLPAIAKVVGLDNHQPLHHFLTVSPWDIKLLRDLQVINCPTVSQNFRAKPRRVVVSLYRATPTVGQFIFWIFLKLQPQSDSKFSSHPWWNDKSGWNNILNNLRLILQPFVFFNLIKPWLKVFKIPELYQGFLKLQRIINYFTNSIFSQLDYWDFHFSSA